MHNAGNELRLASKLHYSGLAMIISGGAITFMGLSTTNNKAQPDMLTYGGLFIAIAGWICEEESFVHINKAGIYLQGNTIVVPLGK
jgi:hypothetical protein